MQRNDDVLCRDKRQWLRMGAALYEAEQALGSQLDAFQAALTSTDTSKCRGATAEVPCNNGVLRRNWRQWLCLSQALYVAEHALSSRLKAFQAALTAIRPRILAVQRHDDVLSRDGHQWLCMSKALYVAEQALGSQPDAFQAAFTASLAPACVPVCPWLGISAG